MTSLMGIQNETRTLHQLEKYSMSIVINYLPITMAKVALKKSFLKHR